MGRVGSDRFGSGPGLLSAPSQRGLGQSRIGSASRRGHGDEALRRLVVEIDAACSGTRREGSLFVFVTSIRLIRRVTARQVGARVAIVPEGDVESLHR